MQVERDKLFARIQKKFGGLPQISGFLLSYPYEKPEDRERFVSALRKAGLPE